MDPLLYIIVNDDAAKVYRDALKMYNTAYVWEKDMGINHLYISIQDYKMLAVLLTLHQEVTSMYMGDSNYKIKVLIDGQEEF